MRFTLALLSIVSIVLAAPVPTDNQLAARIVTDGAVALNADGRSIQGSEWTVAVKQVQIRGTHPELDSRTDMVLQEPVESESLNKDRVWLRGGSVRTRWARQRSGGVGAGIGGELNIGLGGKAGIETGGGGEGCIRGGGEAGINGGLNLGLNGQAGIGDGRSRPDAGSRPPWQMYGCNYGSGQ